MAPRILSFNYHGCQTFILTEIHCYLGSCNLTTKNVLMMLEIVVQIQTWLMMVIVMMNLTTKNVRCCIK